MSADSIPAGADWTYEPKLDGFRGILVRDGDRIDLWSRNGRSLGNRFPELIQAAAGLLPDGCTVDGELVAVVEGGVSFE
jgi:ATP-dependent DNA ligase